MFYTRMITTPRTKLPLKRPVLSFTLNIAASEVPMRLKYFFVTVLSVFFLLSAFGCSQNAENTSPSQNVGGDTAVNPQNIPVQSDKSEHSVASPSQNNTEDYEAALAVAELYRPIYEQIFAVSSTQVNLSREDMQDILDTLGAAGYAVIDNDEEFDMVNPQLISEYFKNVDSCKNAEVSIYQICSDAGFICNKLTFFGGKTSITMTRVAWLDDGPFALAGTTASITYSRSFDVTEISYSEDGYLDYEYFMPDNPEGTNHDGHIETRVKIRVAPR